MAKGKKKNDPVKDKKRKSKASKFRSLGKYFLIGLVLAGQLFIAYTVVEKNYEAIYSYLQSFSPPEMGKYNLDEIIVNPANTNGRRFLLIEISLELVDKEDVKLIEENKSKIRNNLIQFLSSRSVSELQGVEEKEYLRRELMNIINEAIGRRSVHNLYYSKYVMQ